MDLLSSYACRKKIPCGAGASSYVKKLTIVKGSGSDAAGTIYLGDKALNWPNDIRFTKADGVTLLDFYRFESDATDGTWYVELADIGESETDFYIYYGKTSDSDASSGPNTWSHWDNFETNDFSRWTAAGPRWSVITGTKYEGSYAARAYGVTGTIADRAISKTISKGSVKIIFWMRYTSDVNVFYGPRIVLANGAVVIPMAMNAGYFKYFPGTAWANLGTTTAYTAGQWYLCEVVLDFKNSLFRWAVDGVDKGTATLKDMSGNTLDTDDGIATIQFFGCDTANPYGYIDQVCVQDFVYPEPAWATPGAVEYCITVDNMTVSTSFTDVDVATTADVDIDIDSMTVSTSFTDVDVATTTDVDIDIDSMTVTTAFSYVAVTYSHRLLDFYGDSITWGANVTRPDDTFAYKVAQALGRSYTNHGVSSYGVADIANDAGLYGKTISLDDWYVLQGYPNDCLAYVGNANGPDVFETGLLAISAHALIPNSRKVFADQATRSGSWSSATVYKRPDLSSISKYSTDNGATATFVVEGDTVVIATTRLNSNPGSFTVTIDGESKGSISMSPCVTNHLSKTYCPQAHFFTSLGAGEHTVVLTVVSNGTTVAWADWVGGFDAGVVPSDWPKLVFGNQLHCIWPGYTYFTEEQATTWSGIIDDVYAYLAAFGFPIYYVDIWGSVAGNLTNIQGSPDYIHPTASGHTAMADVIVDVIVDVIGGMEIIKYSNNVLLQKVGTENPVPYDIRLLMANVESPVPHYIHLLMTNVESGVNLDTLLRTTVKENPVPYDIRLLMANVESPVPHYIHLLMTNVESGVNLDTLLRTTGIENPVPYDINLVRNSLIGYGMCSYMKCLDENKTYNSSIRLSRRPFRITYVKPWPFNPVIRREFSSISIQDFNDLV